MRSITKMTVAAGLAALGISLLAAAPWNNPRVVQELGLTPEQQQKLEDLTFKNQREVLDLRYEVQQRELALKQEMAKDAPSEAVVNRIIDDLSQAKAKMQKARFRHMQAFRTVLTPEQWQKVKARLEARRGERREGMGRGRGGQRGPQGMRGPGGFGGPDGPGAGPGGGAGYGPGGGSGPGDGASFDEDSAPGPFPPDEGDSGDLP